MLCMSIQWESGLTLQVYLQFSRYRDAAWILLTTYDCSVVCHRDLDAIHISPIIARNGRSTPDAPCNNVVTVALGLWVMPAEAYIPSNLPQVPRETRAQAVERVRAPAAGGSGRRQRPPFIPLAAETRVQRAAAHSGNAAGGGGGSQVAGRPQNTLRPSTPPPSRPTPLILVDSSPESKRSNRDSDLSVSAVSPSSDLFLYFVCRI